MRVTGIETHVLTAKLEGKAFGWSQRVTGTRQAALCVISTDAGIEGLGEAFYFGGPATVVATLMRDGLGPLLVGCDPRDTSVIWDRLYNWTRDQGQKGLTISALSAVDIALWDIKGKALGLPVYTGYDLAVAGTLFYAPADFALNRVVSVGRDGAALPGGRGCCK